jgi:hypothetical protein
MLKYDSSEEIIFCYTSLIEALASPLEKRRKVS